MKTTTEVRQAIAESYSEQLGQSVSLFENPAFTDAIIGVDPEAKKVVYDYNKMVECLMNEDGMPEEEAVEYIEYNTIRTLPYIPNAPVIVSPIYTL